MAQPLAEVWALFRDVPTVAACLPGAQYLGSADDGRHRGKVSAKIGPFQASFEGDAQVDYDEAANQIRLDGKGVDRVGASRGKMTMVCSLQDQGDKTAVSVDTDVQLSGQIAQFGRTGLIAEAANILVADFVRNAEAELVARSREAGQVAGDGSPAPAPRAATASSISVTALLFASFKRWIASAFRRA